MNKGFTLMEVVLTIALLAIIASVFFPLLGWLSAKSTYLSYHNQAGIILQEGVEVTYNVLNFDWDEDFIKYGESSAYHPIIDSGKWSLSSGEELGMEGGRFNRKITLTKICRNKETGKFVEGITGCNEPWVWDKNSKLIKTTVTWKQNGKEVSETAQMLISRL